ncbi:hypothetical protein B0H17DRAFT_1204652 [Mycena rosella]|uniref:Uncharacterized protein n=1 Tax=Mycena rosella TaxID=1033263 RepID=A0AAD7GFM5_MYCRO|nr:hypothetical protein B0H17DRAFT_1204652 [Mycena rosella]
MGIITTRNGHHHHPPPPRGGANVTTLALEKFQLAPKGNLPASVLQGKMLLDKTTTAYAAFYARVSNDPGGTTLDESASNQVLQVADMHSKAFSTTGIALARSLPILDRYGHYLSACLDGVEIGLDAIAVFAQLALKFPRGALALILDGLATNLRVPLTELSALGCFFPILGPLR